MPDQLGDIRVPARERASWRDWAALLLVVGFSLGIWHLDRVATGAHGAADQATAASIANREIGYRNRAAICDFILEFGGVEPSQCTNADIAPYRDHAIRAGEGERANTTRLLCKILATLKTPATQCAGVP